MEDGCTKTTSRNLSVVKTHLNKIAKEKGVKPTLTTMSIKVGLSTAIQHHPKKFRRKLSQYFDDRSRTLGIWRYFISLYANYRYSSCLEGSDDMPKLNKSFFDKCWSAVDKVRMGWNVKSVAEVPHMEKFINITQFPINDLPERTKGEYELRSPICRDMYDTTKTYIRRTFPCKVYSACLFYVNQQVKGDFSIAQQKSIVKALYRSIISNNADVDKYTSQLANLMVELNCDNYTSLVLQICKDQRQRLSKLHNFKLDQKSGWGIAIKAEPQLALEFLAKCSRDYEQYWNELDDNGRYVATQKKIPQAFSLIPIWKCEPVYVDFALTQMHVLYNKMDESCQKKIDPLNLDKGDLHLFDLSNVSQMNHFKKLKWHVTGLSTNGVELVIKISTFRELVIQRPNHTTNREHLFKAGYDLPPPKQKVTINTSKGLFKVSEKRIDVKPLTKQEKHNGEADNIDIICIDPGCSDVISVRHGVLGDCLTPNNIMKNSTSWAMSNKTYQTIVGSGELVSMELGRRKIHKPYNDALNNVQNTRRRTAVTDTLIAHVKALSDKFKAFSKEITSRYRRYMKWKFLRRRTAVIDCIANMILGNITKNTEQRLMKHIDKYKHRENWLPNTAIPETKVKAKIRNSERLIECRKRMRTMIASLRNSKNKKKICFFGDGSFTAKRGNASVPRKDLIRALSQRGLTFMLDEFRTSARCPGCGNIMKDSNTEHRIRQCTSNDDSSNAWSSDGCVFRLKNGEAYSGNRDEIATINMMLCATAALDDNKLNKQRRPTYLCRGKVDCLTDLLCDAGNVSC